MKHCSHANHFQNKQLSVSQCGELAFIFEIFAWINLLLKFLYVWIAIEMLFRLQKIAEQW